MASMSASWSAWAAIASDLTLRNLTSRTTVYLLNFSPEVGPPMAIRTSCAAGRWTTSTEPEPAPEASVRSEEHTSELQSLRHPVCRLLLVKKPGDARRGRGDRHRGVRRRPRRWRDWSGGVSLFFFFNRAAGQELHPFSLRHPFRH